MTTNPTLERLDYRIRLKALDGLRGVAILAVFFYHYAGGTAHATSLPLRVLGTVFAFGWSGVDLFFVLSGFLITGILYDTRNDPAYYRKFYIRRALRIFPAYYLVVVVLLLTTPLTHAHWTPGHLLFLLYLGYPASLLWPSLPHFSSIVLITHVWSLSVEEQFYMIWPWAVAKLRSLNRIILGCILVAGCAIVLRTVLSFADGLSPTWTYTFLFCRMDQLALGGAIALTVRGPWKERLLRWAPFSFFAAAGGVAGICWFRHSVDHSDPLIASIGFSVIAFAYGSLLVCCLRAGSVAERVFSFGPLRTLGKYSYGLYLYHFPLSVFLSPLKEQFVMWTHSYVAGSIVHMIVCLSINLSLAALSFRFFESPIMNLKRRFHYSAENSAEDKQPPTAQEKLPGTATWTCPSSL